MTVEKDEYGKKNEYQYDVDGNLLKHTKPDGTTLTYTYDKLGNKLSEGKRSFTYDKHNNLSTATLNNKTVTYTYDKYDQITKVKDANGNVVSYTWDIYGNKTSMNYKNTKINYQYNDMHKITKVSKGSKEVATYSYDARGNITKQTNGKLSTTYTYDELNRKLSAVTTRNKK